MLGRQDIDRYAKGLYVCLNGLVLAQGPWTRRPGMAFLHQAKYHDKVSRVLPFQYKVTQTYVFEIGYQYIRFFSGHGILVETSQSITSVSKANPGIVTKTSHGYTDGERLEMIDILGMTQLANREVVVTNATANTFELYDSDGNTINTTGYDTFTSGSMAKILEVTTAFTEADIPDVRIAQSNDTFYIFHPDYIPQQLVRNSATSWTLSDMVFTDGPYDVANDTTTTLTPSAAINPATTAITNCADNGSGLIRVTSAGHGLVTGDAVKIEKVLGTTEANGYWEVTRIDANNVDLIGSAFVNAYTSGGTIGQLVHLTASAVTGINDGDGFLAGDVGRLIRMQESLTWGYCEIRFVESTTVVWADVFSTLTNTNPKTDWRLGVFSDTTGWPACGTFFEDRLALAGAASYQQRLDMSRSARHTTFSPSDTDGTVSDDHAMSATLNSDGANAIQWLKSTSKGLAVGTSGAEWLISPSVLGEAVTPTNINAKPQAHSGSASLPAIAVGNVVLFMQRNNRMLRELTYLFQNDSYVANDMTELASHVTAGGVTDIAFQELATPIVWGVRADGTLLGFTYERGQNVTGWHRHELGGYSDSAGTTIPVVEAVCAVSAPDGTRDEIYVVVQRYINGGTKRYIEYMAKPWEEGDAQEDAFFVDSGWTQVDAVASNTISGANHLEGETVGVYVDGTKHPEVTITNGKATLDYEGSTKTIGYYYNSDGQTLPIEGGAQDGSAQGKMKRVSRVGFWLMDTLGLQYGPDAGNLTEVLVRDFGNDVGDRFGDPSPLFTGVIRESFEGDYDRLGQIYWRCSGPFPATVMAVMPQMDTSDDT